MMPHVRLVLGLRGIQHCSDPLFSSAERSLPVSSLPRDDGSETRGRSHPPVPGSGALAPSVARGRRVIGGFR
jgi:hypothetical protein